mmetsp:Transcript_62014/g.134478  ORF Transcript_62014/g.134478 Transcript_62014/m.134478 type:complete len:435 (+) Transcript_62014:53-1357(+)
MRPVCRQLERAARAVRVARGFSSSAVSGEKDSRRRLWRWGATQGGMASFNEVVEVSKEPVLVEDFRGVTAAACGSSHSAFVADGCLYTFGSNKYHQLGHKVAADTAASPTGAPPSPVHLEAEDGHRPKVLQLAMGGYHSAAITEGGALWTWGWGGSFWYGAGGLGHGSREIAEAPTLVRPFVEMGQEIVQVACGAQHTLVLTSEGQLYSAGKGDFGRLGRGDTRDAVEFEEVEYFSQSNDSVLAPDEETEIIKVGAGNNFSAALSRSGELWVWGRNDYGQLGLGEEAMGDMYSAERYPRLVRSLPVEGHRIADFSCGEHHLVVLTTSGAIYEWGNRTWLEPHPVTLPSRYEEGLKDITKVVAGDKCSFALNKAGALYSWGSKASGCLALGEECPKNVVEPTPVPPEVFAHQRIVDIVASKHRCLAITLEDELAT